MGERTNREVALVTQDFRLYHELARFFADQGIQLLGLQPGQPVPDSVRALLDGPPEDPRSTPTRDDREATWLAAMTLVDGRLPLRRVTIGVDPGDTIGLAVICDGMLYWGVEAFSPEAVVERLLAWRDGLAAAQWHLHVGDGARSVGVKIRRLARQAWPELKVSVVKEAKSTPTAAATGSRHVDAAVYIALRQP